MTEDGLTVLERLHAAACPPPWSCGTADDGPVVLAGSAHVLWARFTSAPGVDPKANALAVVSLHNAFPHLLDLVRRQREALAELVSASMPFAVWMLPADCTTMPPEYVAAQRRLVDAIETFKDVLP